MRLISIIFNGLSSEHDDDDVIYPVAHIVKVYEGGSSVEEKLTRDQVAELVKTQKIGKSHAAQLWAVHTLMGRKDPEDRPFAPIELKLVS